jgi:hypothetical protein
MTAPAAKLALIIPRLGSDHDGEVVATARAISRTLTAAGLDWHDLAAAAKTALPVGRGPVPPPRDETSTPLWSELAPEGKLAWLALFGGQTWLSKWDLDFVASIAAQAAANPFRAFSHKQQIILNRLIARAVGYGAHAR